MIRERLRVCITFVFCATKSELAEIKDNAKSRGKRTGSSCDLNIINYCANYCPVVTSVAKETYQPQFQPGEKSFFG